MPEVDPVGGAIGLPFDVTGIDAFNGHSSAVCVHCSPPSSANVALNISSRSGLADVRQRLQAAK